MHFILINPRFKNWSPNVYMPLGLTYIAASLEKAGYSAEIIDLNAHKSNDKGLKERLLKADVVGITGMITEYQEVLRLVEFVKKVNNQATVILGGPLATTLPEELLQVSPADFIVVGEGEKTILNLVSTLSNGGNYADVKGIAYRNSSQIIVTEPVEQIADLDIVPFPARHLLDINQYVKNYFSSFGFKISGFGKIRVTNIISSRGCPYSCTFCFKELWGNKWRGRSPENIIDEMEMLYKTYCINGFLFTDDTFVLDKKRVIRLCELLKERGLNVVWYCNGRVNLMTKEMLETMYDAGCRAIAYGIESGNQQVLESMKKNITLDQVRKVVKWTKETGINTVGYFMIGMLGETKDTIKETIAFARELDMDLYGFSLTTPLAGTELYKSALEAGLIHTDSRSFREWGLYVNANLTKDCSDTDLTAFENETFKEFFLKRRFGKYYFLNPSFLKEEAGVLLSLRNREQAKELAQKTIGVLGSYWRKGSR